MGFLAAASGQLMHLLGLAACGLGGLGALAISLVVIFQDKLVYVPVLPGIPRGYANTPDQARLGGQPLVYEDVWLTASDGVRLHAWLVRPPAAPARRGPTVLFFQENAGNIAQRLTNVLELMRRVECNVLMLSYRGYGDSEGSPSEKGIKRDAQAALDYVVARSDLDPRSILLFGRSLGGAVAAALAAANPDKIQAVILENTFTSILDMAGQVLPFLKPLLGGRNRPLNFLARSPWRTIDLIGSLKMPLLLLSSLQDELVPPSHMKALHAKATSDGSAAVQWVEFANGQHMDLWLRGGERYWRAIATFVQAYVPAVGAQPEHAVEAAVDAVGGGAGAAPRGPA